MRKSRLILFAVLASLLIAAGCNKDEAAAASTTPVDPAATVPGKIQNSQIGSAGQAVPGPGVADAESRVGSKAGGR